MTEIERQIQGEAETERERERRERERERGGGGREKERDWCRQTNWYAVCTKTLAVNTNQFEL